MANKRPKADTGARGGRNPSPDDTPENFGSIGSPDKCEINQYVNDLALADLDDAVEPDEYRPTNGADLGLISDIMDKH